MEKGTSEKVPIVLLTVHILVTRCIVCVKMWFPFGIEDPCSGPVEPKVARLRKGIISVAKGSPRGLRFGNFWEFLIVLGTLFETSVLMVLWITILVPKDRKIRFVRVPACQKTLCLQCGFNILLLRTGSVFLSICCNCWLNLTSIWDHCGSLGHHFGH